MNDTYEIVSPTLRIEEEPLPRGQTIQSIVTVKVDSSSGSGSDGSDLSNSDRSSNRNQSSNGSGHSSAVIGGYQDTSAVNQLI